MEFSSKGGFNHLLGAICIGINKKRGGGPLLDLSLLSLSMLATQASMAGSSPKTRHFEPTSNFCRSVIYERRK